MAEIQNVSGMRKSLSIAFLILCLIVMGSIFFFRSRIDFNNLSTEQLAVGGYYAYLWPEAYVSQFDWKLNISMRSFTWQCEFDIHDHWNPVKIQYTNPSKNLFVSEYISRQDGLWDSTETTSTIQVNANWIQNHMGEYYLSEGTTRLKVKDTLGIDVAFASNIDVTQLTDMIAQMKYIGSSQSYTNDPWTRACGTK